jgi:hypothetical protein
LQITKQNGLRSREFRDAITRSSKDGKVVDGEDVNAIQWNRWSV